MEQLVREYGLLIAALMIFLTELGVPTGVPNELVLLLAGAYAVHSPMGLAVGFVFVTAADVLGTVALYGATRTGGVWVTTHLLAKLGRKPEETFQRWRERLRGRDELVIVVGRLLPLVRMSVAIGAGLLRIEARTFVIGVIPGAMLWAGVPLILGYFFSAHVQRLIHGYERVAHVMLYAVPVAIVAGAGYWLLRRARRSHPPGAESARR